MTGSIFVRPPSSALSGAKQLKNDASGLEEACRDFEAIFIETMLRSARASIPQDGLFSSKEQRTFEDMLDSEWAAQMAAGKGIGLAEYIIRDVLRRGLVKADAPE